MTAGDVPDARAGTHLRLLDFWELRVCDRAVVLGRREQRLVALLALVGRRSRLQLAATLWPDSTEQRAMASLRAAVWHTRHTVDGVLDADNGTLALTTHVEVDVHRVDGLTRELAAARSEPVLERAVAALTYGQLLPGWYDDWVLFERERLDHLRLRTLEAVARARLEAGRPAQAALAARAALLLEPLHEGANVVLVRALLDADRATEAVRHFQGYRRRLAQELGIRPSAALVDLVRPVLVPQQRDRLPQASRK